MATSSLVGLAYLNVTWQEESGTYIDNFVPMVCEVVRSSDDNVVTEPTVKDGLEETFGLDTPQHTVGTLIRRAHRRGFLRKEEHTFHPNPERLDDLDFSTTHERVNNLYNGTVNRLVDYATRTLDKGWNTEKADQALQEYLAEYSLEVLLANEEQSTVPKPSDTSDERLIVSLFIRHLQENEPGVFDLVADLFRGSMLANALFLDEPYNVEEHFEDTTIYLDSPILLDAAGYGYEATVRPQQELVELLNGLGADVACFRSTVEEARGILEACAAIMRSGSLESARDPARQTIDYFYSTDRISVDVDRLAARLDDKLGAIGIAIEERPDYHRDYQIDEQGLKEQLREDIGHYRDEALEHDVEVVSNIARIRRGQPKSHLEHCGAIFVTHNTDLAKITQRFFSSEKLQGTVALVVTDYHMTNVAWLKSPTEAPDLPHKRILADCRAAIQPSDEQWRKFLQEAKRLKDQGDIDVEDYVHIRHSQEVKFSLAEVTLGDDDVITDGTVPEVLERAKRKTQSEAREALERERSLREETEGELRTRTRKDRKNLREIASRLSKTVKWGMVGVGFLLLAVGLYLSFPTDLPAFNDARGNYIGTGVLLVFFVFLLWSSMFGTGFMDLAEEVQEWVYDSVYDRLLQRWELAREEGESS